MYHYEEVFGEGGACGQMSFKRFFSRATRDELGRLLPQHGGRPDSLTEEQQLVVDEWAEANPDEPLVEDVMTKLAEGCAVDLEEPPVRKRIRNVRNTRARKRKAQEAAEEFDRARARRRHRRRRRIIRVHRRGGVLLVGTPKASLHDCWAVTSHLGTIKFKFRNLNRTIFVPEGHSLVLLGRAGQANYHQVFAVQKDIELALAGSRNRDHLHVVRKKGDPPSECTTTRKCSGRAGRAGR